MNCEICSAYFKNKVAISRHIGVHGVSADEYYLKYILKSEVAPTCQMDGCQNPCEYKSWSFRKFCSNSCKTKYLWKNKEDHRDRMREVNSLSLKDQWKDEEFRKRMTKISSTKMTENWKDPKFREKIVEFNQNRVFTDEHRNKLSTARKKLVEEGKFNYFKTPGESILEVLIVNKEYIPQYRYCEGGIHVLMDFYNPKKRINVEVDGRSHKYTLEKDTTRDEYLQKQDVIVLRVQEEVVTSPNNKELYKFVDKL